MSGYSGTQYELYYSLPAPVSRSNYVTATPAAMSALTTTSIPRCFIPANYFSAIGKSLTFYAAGTIANAATAATFIFSGGLDVTPATIGGTGGATLFTSAAFTPTASTTLPFEINGSIVATAVGGAASGTAGGTTLQYNGNIGQSIVATGGAWTASNIATKFSTNITSVNNEVNLYLELFGTFTGTLTSGDITVLQQLKLYLEN